MMVIDNIYNIGDTVYLITDDEQCQRLVTAFLVRKNDIMYELSCGAFTSNHLDFEITNTKNYANV